MAEKRIFISYRRSDASGHAGRLNDYLADYFGSDKIFFDVDTIEPGTDFAQRIANELDNSDAVLVMIGNQWLETKQEAGKRRLDNPDDYVRIEIQTALRKKIQVIPILVQGVQMPSSDMLPEAIRDLSRRNAIRLNDDHWNSDCGFVAAILKNVLNVSKSLKEQKIRRYTSIVFILTALVTLSALLYEVVDWDYIGWGYTLQFLLAVIFLGGAAVNVAVITYLLGNIKKELDRLSWIIIGIAIMAVIVVGWEDLAKYWVGVLMLLEAGLLNFVKPDE